MSNDDLAATREDVAEFKRHTALRGKPIWMMAAARAYKVPQPTLSRWAKRGLIARLPPDPHDPRKVMLDEADVAYCAAIHHRYGGRSGVWIFARDGTPYARLNPPRPQPHNARGRRGAHRS